MNKKPNILCVDGKPSALFLLGIELTQSGYETITAENGDEALAILQRKRVDLVLLSTVMPKLSGYDVCEKIKKSYKTRHIPVVMIGDKDCKENRDKSIKAGADSFISRPFDWIELLNRVRILLKIHSEYG
ncbi:MAG: response regulator [bacterium]